MEHKACETMELGKVGALEGRGQDSSEAGSPVYCWNCREAADGQVERLYFDKSRISPKHDTQIT